MICASTYCHSLLIEPEHDEKKRVTENRGGAVLRPASFDILFLHDADLLPKEEYRLYPYM